MARLPGVWAETEEKMKSEIKDQIQKLSTEKQLDLLYQIAIIKLDNPKYCMLLFFVMSS